MTVPIYSTTRWMSSIRTDRFLVQYSHKRCLRIACCGRTAGTCDCRVVSEAYTFGGRAHVEICHAVSRGALVAVPVRPSRAGRCAPGFRDYRSDHTGWEAR